jgi:cysteine-rich repeat protein
MRRALHVTIPLLVGLTLLCGIAESALANHLHYIPVSDTRYTGLLVDLVGEAPLNEWVIYEGDDQYSSFSNGGLSYAGSEGTGVATAVFDAPFFADVTNAQATAAFELEIAALDDSGIQSIEIGLTDLDNEIKYDEAAGTMIGTRSGLGGDSVVGIPRFSTVGSYPLRVQMYYHFSDHVLTVVVIDGATGASQSASWQGSVNPFVNFFGDGIGGTDPDNLDIYPFVLCEASCGPITALQWDILDCDTSAGEIDLDGCSLPTVGNGRIDFGETCDDGNVVAGDGCDENGQLEEIGWKCQEAIGKAGEKYARARLRILRKCRDALNKGKALFQDRKKTLPIADRSECLSEFRTARTIANTRGRVRKIVTGKCTDALVGTLSTCGDTVDELVSADGTAGCLVEGHDTAVDMLLTTQYGG